MRIIVTGGAGFLGTYVVRELVEAGHDLVVVDRLDHGAPRMWPPGVPLIDADVRAWPDHQSALAGSDAVIHLAASASVPAGERDPVRQLDDNVGATAAALVMARAVGAASFCFASSAAVYGDPGSRDALTENRPAAPLSVYGVSKWAGERLTALWQSNHGLQTTILRPANIYGPGQADDGEGGVVTLFADRLRRGEALERFGDGEQTRDFIFVADAAHAFVHAALNPTPSGPGREALYNIGTGTTATINQVGALLAEAAGVALRWDSRPPRPGDIRHSLFQVTRATAWGFSARVSLREGLACTWRGTE